MRKLVLCLLLVALAGVLCAQLGQRGSRYAQDGQDYFKRGDYKKAIERYLAADRAAAGSIPEYRYWLGRLHVAMADTVKAFDWFDKYTSSGDTAYKSQVEAYLRIFQRQPRIFNRIGVRQLPDYFNSRYSDYGAVPDPSGRYLYFTSLRPAAKAKENIWRAEIFRSGFGRPELVEELSTDRNEAFGTFSADGSAAWIFGNYEPRKRDGDIYRVTWDEGWSSPVNAGKLNSPHLETQPMIYRDRYLFFVSARPGGYGGTDIYVSERIGSLWTEPQNLGTEINTPENEQTPFLAADGRTLFFSSRGHPGFGGYDIFKAFHTGYSWQDWSVPENLGLPVNSTRNDRYFFPVTGSNEGYMSSDRSASGSENIYQVSFEFASPTSYLQRDASGNVISVDVLPPTPPAPKLVDVDTVLAKIDEGLDLIKLGLNVPSGDNLLAEYVALSQKPLPRPISLTGRVVDQRGLPVSTEIELSYMAEGVRNRELMPTNAQGLFEGLIPRTDLYTLVINAPGYLLHSQDLQLAPTSNTFKLDVTLRKPQTDTPETYPPLLFAYESSVLDASAQQMLEEVVVSLLNNPNLKLRISGHAREEGSAAFDQELSEKRARSVFDFLVGKGIERKRLTWKGYGGSKPVPGTTLEAQRRVELEAF